MSLLSLSSSTTSTSLVVPRAMALYPHRRGKVRRSIRRAKLFPPTLDRVQQVLYLVLFKARNASLAAFPELGYSRTLGCLLCRPAFCSVQKERWERWERWGEKESDRDRDRAHAWRLNKASQQSSHVNKSCALDQIWTRATKRSVLVSFLTHTHTLLLSFTHTHTLTHTHTAPQESQAKPRRKVRVVSWARVVEWRAYGWVRWGEDPVSPIHFSSSSNQGSCAGSIAVVFTVG
jgi:hypothetical protein